MQQQQLIMVYIMFGLHLVVLRQLKTMDAELFLVGGGGGGGVGDGGGGHVGGGGAGGVVQVVTFATGKTYNVTIGGGTGGSGYPNGYGANGQNSSITIDGELSIQTYLHTAEAEASLEVQELVNGKERLHHLVVQGICAKWYVYAHIYDQGHGGGSGMQGSGYNGGGGGGASVADGMDYFKVVQDANLMVFTSLANSGTLAAYGTVAGRQWWRHAIKGGVGGGGIGGNCGFHRSWCGTANRGGGGGGGSHGSSNVRWCGGLGIVVMRYAKERVVESESANQTSSLTGGSIEFHNDETFHTFNTSGTFMAGVDMNVDVLIVGSGGGGGYDSGGGGWCGWFNISF